MMFIHSLLAAVFATVTLAQTIHPSPTIQPVDQAQEESKLTILLRRSSEIPGDESCKTNCANALLSATSIGPTYCTSSDFVWNLNQCLSCTLEPQNADIWTLYDISGLGQPCGQIASPGQNIGQSWTTVSKMPEFTVPTGRPVGKMVVQSGSVMGSGETATSKAGVDGPKATGAVGLSLVGAVGVMAVGTLIV